MRICHWPTEAFFDRRSIAVIAIARACIQSRQKFFAFRFGLRKSSDASCRLEGASFRLFCARGLWHTACLMHRILVVKSSGVALANWDLGSFATRSVMSLADTTEVDFDCVVLVPESTKQVESEAPAMERLRRDGDVAVMLA